MGGEQRLPRPSLLRRGPRGAPGLRAVLTRLPLPAGAVTMLGADEFISSPPRKTVRFGGTLTEILLKYEKVTAAARGPALRPGCWFRGSFREKIRFALCKTVPEALGKKLKAAERCRLVPGRIAVRAKRFPP